MTNPELTHTYLLDQQRQLTAQEAREKVAAYISGRLRHLRPSGYENDEDEIEGKNA